MEKNKVINSIYLLPAIIEKLEGKENKNIDNILKEFNVDAEDYRDLNNLIKYHVHTISSDFKPNYPLLRKGLSEYFNKYLRDFWLHLNIIGTDCKLLDYGCGDGSYSDEFLLKNPDGDTLKIDKQYGVDFEKNPEWNKNHELEFDIVLLSEILHCKDKKGQMYLIDSALYCLKEGGKLIINENIDPFMGWRLNKLTENGDTMNEDEIINLLNMFLVDLRSIKTINNHKIYTYEKF